jgi:CheY-like chemotaxis protein
MVAKSGEASLRALEHERFDLMILDIFMAYLRGFESVRILPSSIPLLAMKGYAFQSRHTAAGLSTDGARTWRRSLPAQAVHVQRRCLPSSTSVCRKTTRQSPPGRAVGLARPRPMR